MEPYELRNNAVSLLPVFICLKQGSCLVSFYDPSAVTVWGRKIKIALSGEFAGKMHIVGNVALHDHIDPARAAAFIVKQQRFSVSVQPESLYIAAEPVYIIV